MMPMVGENPPADSKMAGTRSSSLGAFFDLDLHDLAQLGGFGAVDGEHDRLFEEWVVDVGRSWSSETMPLRRALLAKSMICFERLVAVLLVAEEDLHGMFEGAEDGGQRELQHDRAERAAEDDHGGGRLQDLAEAAALDQQSGDDGGDRDEDSDDAAFVH